MQPVGRNSIGAQAIGFEKTWNRRLSPSLIQSGSNAKQRLEKVGRALQSDGVRETAVKRICLKPKPMGLIATLSHSIKR